MVNATNAIASWEDLQIGMDWQKIAGSVVSALKNAGVKKDVIDVQEKQLALLTDEIALLTRNLKASETKVRNLGFRVADLEQELGRFHPKTERLDENSEKLLQLFARPSRSAPSLEEAAREMAITQVRAEYHAEILIGEKMTESFAYDPTKGMIYAVTAKGRSYLVKNGLV